MRICVDKNCGWSGSDEQCVYPKHNSEMILCPECYEVTEEMREMDYWSAEYKQRMINEIEALHLALEAADELATLVLHRLPANTMPETLTKIVVLADKYRETRKNTE